MDLPIDVGLSNMVHVDERQTPYSTAGQCFCGPGAHAPHAHNDHMRAANALRTGYTVESFQPAKATLRHLVWHRQQVRRTVSAIQISGCHWVT
jgi:hypothetical protein